MALSLFFGVVLLLGAAVPVLATPPMGPDGEPAPTQPPAEPAAPASTPAPDSETPAPPAPNASSNDGGGLFGDPVSWVTTALVGIVESIAAGIHAFFVGMTATVFGVPAVGEIRDATTWGDVDGPFWPVVRSVYLAMSGLALLVLGGAAMHALSNHSGRALKQRLWTLTVSFGMVILGWWVAQFCLHIANAVALAFAPDPSTLFATPGNAGKFGLTLVVGALLLLLNAGAVAMAAIVIIVEKAVILICVALWPIFWAFRPLGGYSDTVAGLGLGTFFGVLGAKILQAIIAHMVWNIEWAGIHATEAVGALLGQVVGAGITFVGIPLIIGRNFIPEAMTMFGKPAVDVADDFSDTARGRAREQARAATAGYASSARGQADANTTTNTTTRSAETSPPSLRNDSPRVRRSRQSRRTQSVSVAADDPYLDARSEREAERKRREINRRNT